MNEVNNRYFHIFNKGIENLNIFKDTEDYATFIKYLNGYLSSPSENTPLKESFVIKGRTYKGIPHQPKNYYDKLELITYNLSANHFHLVLNVRQQNFLTLFVKSLITRYAIYFNKKYQRTGPLFPGPYKSIDVTDPKQLLLLAYLFQHDNTIRNNIGQLPLSGQLNDMQNHDTGEGSRMEFIFKQNVNILFGYDNLQDYLTNHVLSEEEIATLKMISLEDISVHYKPEPEKIPTQLERIPTDYQVTEAVRNESAQPEYPVMATRKMVAVSALVFVLLLGFGIRNVRSFRLPAAVDTKTTNHPAETISEVKAVSVNQLPTGTAPETPIFQQIVINTTDISNRVNIREAPSDSSPILGSAGNGEIFNLVNENNGWYQIALSNGTYGFVYKKLVKTVREDKN